MNIKILLIAIISALLGVLKTFKQKRKREREERIHVEDPEAQQEYIENKYNNDKDDKKNLSLQDKVELSWQFLTRITKQVLEKFTKDEQNTINHAGNTLLEYGMEYKHNVNQELEILSAQSRTKTITRSVTKDKGKVRRR